MRCEAWRSTPSQVSDPHQCMLSEDSEQAASCKLHVALPGAALWHCSLRAWLSSFRQLQCNRARLALSWCTCLSWTWSAQACRLCSSQPAAHLPTLLICAGQASGRAEPASLPAHEGPASLQLAGSCVAPPQRAATHVAGNSDPVSTPAREALPAGRISEASIRAEPGQQVSSRLPLDKGTLAVGERWLWCMEGSACPCCCVWQPAPAGPFRTACCVMSLHCGGCASGDRRQWSMVGLFLCCCL